jgi:hypothetical protein
MSHPNPAQRLALGSLALVAILLVPTAAFAQVTPSAPVNETTGIIMGLSALLGILTNWVQTGTLLGRWITPKTWLPDVTMLVTFLGGFLGSIESGNPVTLSGSAIYVATIAGILSLTAGVAPTLARHVHGPMNDQQLQQNLSNKAANGNATPSAPPQKAA